MRKIISLAGLVLCSIYLFGCGIGVKTTGGSSEVVLSKKPVGKIGSNGLSLILAPWVDGEMMRLKISSLQSEEIGTVIYLAEADTKDGNDIWRIISQNYISTSDSRQYATVNANLGSFKPIFSRTVNLLGDFTAEYGKKKVKLQSVSVAGEITKDVDVNSVVYDNEQLVHLIRRMSLEKGFKTSFSLFAIMSGQVVDCSVVVAGKESVTVAAGTFECYRVNLSMRSGDEKPLEHSMWISADQHRYLAKYISDMTMILELVEVAAAEKGVPLTFEDTELGFVVAVPYDWRFYKHKAGQGSFLELLAPKLKAKAALCILPAPGGSDAGEIARKDVEVFKKMFKGYTVRGEGFSETSVGGVKAIQYLADLLEEANAARKYPSPKEVVEYRTYMVSGEHVYFFVFRAEKDKFDGMKSEFDAIIQSFEPRK